jgi:hypothetical protein
MSNALAIAAVTAVLKDILENGLAHDPIATSIGDTLVTALPPDRVSVGTDERPQLNVFLYQVSPNRNADWLGREQLDFRGSHPGQMPLALDLHYLLTAYSPKDFQSELLLGYALQLLHEIPVLTPAMVHTALKHAAAVSSFGVLSQALASLSIEELANQVAPIKLCSEFFSMEETSKLWSSLQTHYRPSAGYQASMVLIGRSDAGKTEQRLPRLPVIDQIEPMSSSQSNHSFASGERVMLRGKYLQGEVTRIRIHGRSSILTPLDVRDNQISFTLPADLSIGVQGLQVLHLDRASLTPNGQELVSNLAAFVVHPTFTVTVSDIQNLSKKQDKDQRTAQLQIKVKPAIAAHQSAIVRLHAIDDLQSCQPFILPTEKTDRAKFDLPIQVKAGTYWVQLQVEDITSSILALIPGNDKNPSPPPFQITIS